MCSRYRSICSDEELRTFFHAGWRVPLGELKADDIQNASSADLGDVSANSFEHLSQTLGRNALPSTNNPTAGLRWKSPLVQGEMVLST